MIKLSTFSRKLLSFNEKCQIGIIYIIKYDVIFLRRHVICMYLNSQLLNYCKMSIKNDNSDVKLFATSIKVLQGQFQRFQRQNSCKVLLMCKLLSKM